MQRARRSSSRMAKQAVTRSLEYAYRDRRNRKRDFRQLWITRINAAARERGTTYRELVHDLGEANVQLDRKILAELAATQPRAFDAIVESAKKK